MGTAIGYALAQPAAVTFAIFTALALGLAAPYVALTLQPAWTRLLPRPGAWMDDSEAGRLGSHLRHGHLADVGRRAGLRRESSARAARHLSAARHCRMVPGPLAGAAVGDNRRRAYSVDCACCLHHHTQGTCDGTIIGVDAILFRKPHGTKRWCVAALVGRRRPTRARGRATRFCGLHRQLVPELPGQ